MNSVSDAVTDSVPGLTAQADDDGAARPTRMMQFWNLVVVHIAWFAAVLGSAHRMPVLGTAVVLASIGWHLAVSARWRSEAKLVGAALLIGLVVESAMAPMDVVTFTSGQFAPRTAPYWMVSLWGMLGMTLNVTMRWLKGRWLLAAIAGAVVGPLSYVSGVDLGAAKFVDENAALVILVVVWAVLMPSLMWISDRWDGVLVTHPARAGGRG